MLHEPTTSKDHMYLYMYWTRSLRTDPHKNVQNEGKCVGYSQRKEVMGTEFTATLC